MTIIIIVIRILIIIMRRHFLQQEQSEVISNSVFSFFDTYDINGHYISGDHAPLEASDSSCSLM